MVSPRAYRPRRGDHIEDCNSTATLFLGRVRRNWMSVPKPAQLPIAMQSDGDDMSLSTSSLRHDQATPTAPPPPMSPVTPGGNLHQSTNASVPASDAATSNKTDPPTTALPSPVLSAGSHPSPVIEHRPMTGPAVVTTNEAAATASRLPPGPPTGPATETDADTGDVAVSRPSSRSGATQVPARSPSDTTIVRSSAQESIPPLLPVGSRLQSPNVMLPTEERWAQWKASCDALKPAMGGSSLIAEPRISLLRDACHSQDLFYLVLHQVYCRLSIDNQILLEYPLLRESNCQSGLEKMEELLESNDGISKMFLLQLAQFPAKSEDLTQELWYSVKIKELAQFLSLLASRFASIQSEIYKRVRSRRYPPLVKELFRVFKVRSPVIMGVIFASMCRSLYDECHLPKLNMLFRDDLSATFQGLDERVSRIVIREYLKIPMRALQPTSREPEPGLQPSSGPMSFAPSGSQPQAVPLVTQPALRVNTLLHPSGSSPRVMNSSTAAHLNCPVSAGSPLGLPANTLHCHPCASQMSQHPEHVPYQYPSQHIPPDPSPLTAPGHQPTWQLNQFRQMVPTSMQPASHPSQIYSGFIRQMPVYSNRTHRTPQSPIYPVASQSNSPSVASRPVSTLPSQAPQQNGVRPSRPPVPMPSLHPVGGPQAALVGQGNLPTARMSQSQTHTPQSQYTPQFFPPPGYRAPQTVNPNPMRLGIHQADLREPIKKLVQRPPSGEMLETELFHYLGGFTLEPHIVDPATFSYTWDFAVTPDDWKRFPLFQETKTGSRPTICYQTGCRSLRLRSIALRGSEKQKKEQLWPTAPTTWPSVFYLFVNDTELQVRRKVHNGKDLPLDITRHLRPGANKLSIHLLLGPDECKDMQYAFGIENMETVDFTCASGHVGRLPADVFRTNIQQRLNPKANDDDLAVVTDSLTVSLIDPFTAQIFQVPARSIHCNHQECFDLDTFIKTRKSESGSTPMNDNWRCPICNADARPMNLVVDCFLQEVRAELMRSNRLEGAQAIQICADGTWTVKTTVDESTSSERPYLISNSAKRKADSMTDVSTTANASRARNGNSPRNSSTNEPMVIEID
ncbi:uncharacterized protein N7459_008737 [Penicillium hispanicum]|uniref:uncharacterized protein n=1 Tax=Penicillium hispanicum TaxID=1080232 RepID=UPI0025422D7C|nr:uncharacterized protein N7459_008737 [Penicillium hispanicum]KAJ5574310.1 hypothetical protein N7459_008737 [Penicillium hispanicum]